MKLKQKIVFTAIQEPLKPLVKNTCRALKPRDTWEDQSPRGYWEHDKWRPLSGCSLPKFNRSTIFTCLNDTHFITFGDSNARKVMERILEDTKCTLHNLKKSPHRDLRHTSTTFYCRQSNLRISWYYQALPFFFGVKQWMDIRATQKPNHFLYTLNATEKYVVVIHLYLHFTWVHMHVFTLHVRDTARAVLDLLQRNPNVKVFIRGPHTTGAGDLRILNDFHGERFLRVLRHEFRDLRDHVVLLNTWDMTVANENCDYHPSREVVTTVCQMIFSYVCPKQF